MLAQISANQAQIASLNATVMASRLVNLEGVRTYVENLPQNNSLEANFRTLLLLRVKQHSEETWTTADSTALRAIAYSCPEVGGEAVTTAREMLPSPEAYSFGREGADPLCGEGLRGASEEREKPAASIGAVIIWPNPANELLNVDFGRLFSGKIEVISASGIVVRSAQFKDIAKTNLHIEGLPNGVYLLRISAPGEAAQIQKFSVIR